MSQNDIETNAKNYETNLPFRKKIKPENKIISEN